jgi:hypothetical protein
MKRLVWAPEADDDGQDAQPSAGFGSGDASVTSADQSPTRRAPFDLWYDGHLVGGDLAVECWISHGPRSTDPTFDRRAGDSVTVGDEDEPPLPAQVIDREGDRVRLQVHLSSTADRSVD